MGKARRRQARKKPPQKEKLPKDRIIELIIQGALAVTGIIALINSIIRG